MWLAASPDQMTRDMVTTTDEKPLARCIEDVLARNLHRPDYDRYANRMNAERARWDAVHLVKKLIERGLVERPEGVCWREAWADTPCALEPYHNGRCKTRQEASATPAGDG